MACLFELNHLVPAFTCSNTRSLFTYFNIYFSVLSEFAVNGTDTHVRIWPGFGYFIRMIGWYLGRIKQGKERGTMD
jgi:hypothetical protein